MIHSRAVHAWTDRGSPPPDDAGLLERLRAGDEHAFELLVRTYTGRLLAVTRRLLRNEEDARDAVQEAFVSAFRSLAGFQGSSQLSTWLHRIALNAALMKLRTQRRRPEESIDDLLPRYQDDGHHVERFVSWTDRADRALERRETCAYVRQCIDRLPDAHRTVLMLRDIEGMETPDIAEMLGISPNAVKIRVHRARQALRTLLDPYFRGAGS